MIELDSRIIATSVVQALREQGATVQEITVEPHPSGGIRLRVALDEPVDTGDRTHPSVALVECDVPAGYFAYEQVAAALIQATGRCSIETT